MLDGKKKCQGHLEDLVSCSIPTPNFSCMYKFFWHLKREGVIRSLGLILRKVRGRFGISTKNKPCNSKEKVASAYQETLNLQPGELVQVKSYQEISVTLDENGFNKGLLWMPTMQKFCGKKFRVYKRLKRIMIESTGEIRNIKNTVLLEGVVCEDLYDCDRSCFHFWREVWLHRVTGDQSPHDSDVGTIGPNL